MIVLLEQKFGPDHCRQLLQMGKDIRNQDAMQLKNFMGEESKDEDPIEFNVKVLTRGDWP